MTSKDDNAYKGNHDINASVEIQAINKAVEGELYAIIEAHTIVKHREKELEKQKAEELSKVRHSFKIPKEHTKEMPMPKPPKPL